MGQQSGEFGTQDVTFVRDGVAVGSLGANQRVEGTVALDNSVPGITNGVVIAAPYPVTAVPFGNGSGNAAAAIATATIPAVQGKTFYVTSVSFTASGATSGLAVAPTLTGVVGGTRTFAFVFPAGVLVQAQPLVLTYFPPLAAAGQNTAVVATLPASGSGGTNAAVTIDGYYL